MKKAIFLAAALATAGMAHAQNVRIATEGAYPPYNLIDDNGDLGGFEIELGNEMCARAKLDCVWVKNDWDGIIPNLTSGNYDAIMAGMAITDERKKKVAFTQNYMPPSPSSYVGMSDDIDVNNSVVSAQAGTIQASHVAESGATLVEFPTGDEALAAVRNGEADATLIDKDFLVPFVNDSNGELVWIGDDVALGDGIGMAVRQSDDKLREQFDAVITEMKQDGSLNEMIKKWFGDDAVLYEN